MYIDICSYLKGKFLIVECSLPPAHEESKAKTMDFYLSFCFFKVFR